MLLILLASCIFLTLGTQFQICIKNLSKLYLFDDFFNKKNFFTGISHHYLILHFRKGPGSATVIISPFLVSASLSFLQYTLIGHPIIDRGSSQRLPSEKHPCDRTTLYAKRVNFFLMLFLLFRFLFGTFYCHISLSLACFGSLLSPVSILLFWTMMLCNFH